MNSTTINKSLNGILSITDGTISIEDGSITFSDGTVLDSLTDIALKTADNTFTGSNTFNTGTNNFNASINTTDITNTGSIKTTDLSCNNKMIIYDGLEANPPYLNLSYSLCIAGKGIFMNGGNIIVQNGGIGCGDLSCYNLTAVGIINTGGVTAMYDMSCNKITASGAIKTTANLDVSGNTGLTGTLYVKGVSTTTGITNTGAIKTTTNLDVSGNTGLTGTLNVNGTINSLKVKGGAYSVIITGSSGTFNPNNITNWSNFMIGTGNFATTTTGSNNIAIGDNIAYSMTSGNRNIGFGNEAMKSILTGNDNISIGTSSGILSGASPTAIIQGDNNIYIGSYSGADNTGFSQSTALGYGARISASNQVVLGAASETVYIPGSLNVNGITTLKATTSSTLYSNGALVVYGGVGIKENLNILGTLNAGAINYSVITSNSNFNNRKVVLSEVTPTTSTSFFGFGYQAGTLRFQVPTSTNSYSFYADTSLFCEIGKSNFYLSATNDSYNILMGKDALTANTTGAGNIAIGGLALNFNTTGSSNTAIGYQAGSEATQSTAYNNTYIGRRTLNTGNFSSSTAIGAYSQITANNQIMLGTAGEHAICAKYSSAERTYINFNTNGGGSTQTITVPSAGIFIYTIGLAYADMNLLTSLYVFSTGTGTLKLTVICATPSWTNTTITPTGSLTFTIVATGIPGGYNSFSVEYIRLS